MTKKFSVIPLLCAVLWPAIALSEPIDDIVIVANNATELPNDPEAARIKLRQMYLKQSRAWPNGVDTQPFARPSESDVQRKFEEFILMMNEDELAAYWLRLKQTRGETRPKTIGADRIFLRQIARKPGTFGAISRESFDGAQVDGAVIIFDLDADTELEK